MWLVSMLRTSVVQLAAALGSEDQVPAVLLPAFVVYTVAGVDGFWRRVSWATAPAAVLLAALLVMTHMYLLAFAVG